MENTSTPDFRQLLADMMAAHDAPGTIPTYNEAVANARRALMQRSAAAQPAAFAAARGGK